MNSWLTRFRISAARDANRPLSESLRQKINCSAELREFDESISALEQALRTDRPEPSAPPFLAASIMRAVKKSETPAARVPSWLTPIRTLLAGTMAVLGIVCCVFWFLGHRPLPPGSTVVNTLTPGAALQWSDTVTHALPLATVAPLNDELARMNMDLTNTASFLLANVP